MQPTWSYQKRLCAGTALSLSIVGALAPAAYAQDDSDGGLDVIVVTAQKREQDVQDVPIAVTAITSATIQANRVTSVGDLSGLAPGLTVMPTAGASRVPSFTMRGAVANGVVNGSDRQVSVYLDGVYLSAPRGAIFDLPDVRSIEVLRGPQGTLFGRNSTAGAISVRTRDPSGEPGVKAMATVGNYNQYRFGLGVDLPRFGPFSAYVSYLHNYQRGEIRNLGAGALWDRTSSLAPRYAKIYRSPKYLGTLDADTYFAALKFESGDFTTIYKYDRTDAGGTAPGTALIGYETQGVIGNLISALITSQPTAIATAPNARRPKAVNNSFATDIDQSTQGHNLTSNYIVSDHITLRNIFAYRKSSIFGASSIDGFSALTFTEQALPAYSALSRVPIANLRPLVGSPFIVLGNAAQSRNAQLSDEFQFNYNSSLLTATVGAMWFQGKDWSYELFQQATISFAPLPGGLVPNRNIGRGFNKAVSIAAYTQLEFHVLEGLDILGGARVTRDKKTGTFMVGATLNNLVTYPFEFRDTRPSFLVGVNYKPNRDTLLYAKYSTAYMSGGSVVGIPFPPETVKSIEGGAKTEFFNRKLRANLAIYLAKYRNVQGPQSATTPGSAQYITAVTGGRIPPSAVSTFISTLGNLKAYGAEFDFDAAPIRRFTVGGSLGYTHSELSEINPIILSGAGGQYDLGFRPKWTANVYMQYDTPRFVAGDAYLSFRGDMRWQSRMNFAQNRSIPAYASGGYAEGALEAPAYAIYNARVALKDFELGTIKTEIAAWGKNLADNRVANYALLAAGTSSANFTPARTYGLDLIVSF